MSNIEQKQIILMWLTKKNIINIHLKNFTFTIEKKYKDAVNYMCKSLIIDQ